MSRLAHISPHKLIKFLGKEGFVCIRIRGSHHFFHHPNGRTTTVPLHGNRDIGIGLLRSILRDIDFSVDLFQKKL